MKKGREIRDLAGILRTELATKKDYVADTGAMRFNEGGRIELKGLGEFSPTKWSLNQMSDNLDIPRSYVERMSVAGASPLLASNFNYWLGKDSQKRLIRTNDRTMRAYLSNRYRPLDNWELLSAVMPTFEEKQLSIQSSELTDTKFYLKATLPSLRGDVKVGDTVEAGICISNSEIGASSVRVEPLIMRLMCMNGAVMNTSIRKYHVGKNNYDSSVEVQNLLTDETKELNDRAFWMSVRDIVSASFREDVFNVMLDKMREAAGVPIKGNYDEVVEVTRKTYGFSEEIGSQILNNLIEDRDYSKWGLSNAVTKLANSTEDYEFATTLERVGGEIIELGPREWSKLVSVAA